MPTFSWPDLWRVGIYLALTLAALMLARILLTWLRRGAGSHFGFRHLLSQVRRPLLCLLPLLALNILWPAEYASSLFMTVLRHLALLGLIAVVIWLCLRLVSAIQWLVLQRNPVDISDNLQARRIQTQTRVLVRTLKGFVLLIGFGCMLMTFPQARQLGASLLASAGIAGLVAGLAARPVLGNMIAGLQIAMTQPIRLDDVVIVENEWGRIEEITSTYVVVRIWDERRLVMPLQWFIEKPFQNWTRTTSSLIGSVFIWVDYGLPLAPIRAKLEQLCRDAPGLWDGRVCVLQVTDASDRAMQLRALVSSGDSSSNWDLRCFIREQLIQFIGASYPDCLPHLRAEISSRSPPPDVVHEAASSPEHQPPV